MSTSGSPPVPLIELAHISRYYQTGETVLRALDEVSLTIWPGEFVAIIGQSGSGESTLMNIIGCLDQPTSGSYHLLGQDILTREADAIATLRSHTFGFIFQRYNLLHTETAEENVALPALYAGVPKTQRLNHARELLTQLGLGERLTSRPNQLSGGQQQRVAIARALMNDPKVILADEPTGALDSKNGQDVLGTLRQLHAEGRTVILITHDKNVAAQANRIIQIQDGKITHADDEKIASAHPTIAYAPKSEKSSTLFSDISESAKTALRSLKLNLFRTLLTLLGIIIGVSAVVTMVAMGQGSKQKVLDQITAMGTNLLSVRPGAPGTRGGGDTVTLTPEDAEAILTLENVELVMPERGGRYTLRYGNIDYNTTIQAVGSKLPIVRDWPLAKGEFFSDRDLRSYAPVIVLGQTAADNLFPYDKNPIGKYVLVRNVPFEIIGLLTAKGASGFGGDQDDVALVPLTTGFIRLFGNPYLNAITVRVTDLATMQKTQDAITELLMKRHRKEDFRVRNMASILEAATETQNTLTILLAAVAAISLLVGGVGVMNIMLVNVTERTREIGIRMATGARRRDILLQFNTEAVVVCSIGGVLGVAIGCALIWVLNQFEIAAIFSPLPALLAFICAFMTGVIFGYLPARKAAYLNPVDALASE